MTWSLKKVLIMAGANELPVALISNYQMPSQSSWKLLPYYFKAE